MSDPSPTQYTPNGNKIQMLEILMYRFRIHKLLNYIALLLVLLLLLLLLLLYVIMLRCYRRLQLVPVILR